MEGCPVVGGLLCFFFLSSFFVSLLLCSCFSLLFSCSYSSLSPFCFCSVSDLVPKNPELNPKPRTLHPISDGPFRWTLPPLEHHLFDFGQLILISANFDLGQFVGRNRIGQSRNWPKSSILGMLWCCGVSCLAKPNDVLAELMVYLGHS